MGAVTGPQDCYQSTHSPKNPAYEFPRTGLKPFKALLREPAMLTVFPHCLRDPHLKTTYTPVGFPSVYGVPLNRVWNCARRRHPPLLQSIYSIGHRSKSFSRRKTSRTSAHFRAGHRPVSIPLQDGFRFFRHPTPAHPWAHLAACFPSKGRHTGLPRSAS